jgi:hypothetical protein
MFIGAAQKAEERATAMEGQSVGCDSDRHLISCAERGNGGFEGGKAALKSPISTFTDAEEIGQRAI